MSWQKLDGFNRDHQPKLFLRGLMRVRVRILYVNKGSKRCVHTWWVQQSWTAMEGLHLIRHELEAIT